LKRAATAKAGIYANDPVEATYPLTRTDAAGEPLDGTKHNYTLTFPNGQLPPVNAFWSVTMYDGKTQLLIKNPINRYLINSPMLPNMKRNQDGSLTLYIQKDSPGTDKEANSRAERRHLPRYAPLLATHGSAIRSASRRRQLEAAGHREGELNFSAAARPHPSNQTVRAPTHVTGDVRFWPKADIPSCTAHVRFRG
jgi:Protein of unknown function (DUF1214)